MQRFFLVRLYSLSMVIAYLGLAPLLYGPPPPPGPPGPAAPAPAPNPGPGVLPNSAVLIQNEDANGSPVRPTGRESFSGSWQRTDGPYMLSISDVDTDKNTAKVAYFNPQPINVAYARFVKKNNQWELTVVLQDKEYEASKYVLYYDSEGPKLVGRYTVGSTQKTYEVTFVRKKEESGGPG